MFIPIQKRKSAAARRFACAMILAALFAPAQASAQGPRLESFFDDAQRFLEKQGRALERELQDLSGPEPPRPRADIAGPPLPPRNPLRTPEPAALSTEGIPAKPRETITTMPQPAAPEPVREAPARPVATALPLPDRNPLFTTQEQSEPEAPPHPRAIEVPDWTQEQIEQAKAECDAALSGLRVEYTALASIREGQCGAPYPIKLSSIGAAPAVAIDPPATLTCAMTVELNRWLNDIVQPAARETLGSPVVGLRNVASYVCRNRYNAPGKRISEHALANALDIAAFTTGAGETVTLLQHWTRNEAPENGASPDGPDSQPPAASTGGDSNEASKGAEQKTVPGAQQAVEKAASAEPSPESEPPAPPDPKDRFLRRLHTGACGIFGTVLGPEANESHHDHFHLDMKERRNGGYCE